MLADDKSYGKKEKSTSGKKNGEFSSGTVHNFKLCGQSGAAKAS